MPRKSMRMRHRKTLRRLRSKKHSRKVHSRRTHKMRSHKLRGGIFGWSKGEKEEKARKLQLMQELQRDEARKNENFDRKYDTRPSREQQDAENAKQAAYYDEMRSYEAEHPEERNEYAPWNM